MEWGGAIIGWQYNSSLYEKHSLSGSNSDDVGCLNFSSYSAHVYRLGIFLICPLCQKHFAPLQMPQDYVKAVDFSVPMASVSLRVTHVMDILTVMITAMRSCSTVTVVIMVMVEVMVAMVVTPAIALVVKVRS